MVDDSEIGANLALLRGEMSQDALAERMKHEHGHKWSQSTVWSVERGSRPLRLIEAQSLAEIFSTPLTSLIQSTEEADFLARANNWIGEQIDAELALSTSVDRILNAQKLVGHFLTHELPKYRGRLPKHEREWLEQKDYLTDHNRIWIAVRAGVLEWLQHEEGAGGQITSSDQSLDEVVSELTGLPKPQES